MTFAVEEAPVRRPGFLMKSERSSCAVPTASGALIPRQAVWSALAAVLLTIGPLFICLPLNSDTALFDLQAAVSRDGGILYRDVIEPNLPGIVWLHSAIRTVAGWSSEAMRVADLLIFAGILALCGAMLHRARDTFRPAEFRPAESRWLFVAVATLFYLSTNEWCHAQRDTWMLLPALAAVLVRANRPKAASASPANAVLEGVCWGAAFWIKPHVAVPVVAVIVADVTFQSSRRQVVREVLLVVAGGILIATPGILLLIATGAWPHFCDMMLNWNPEYLAAGAERKDLQRWLLMAERFRPWWAVHVLAIPLAVKTLCRRSILGSANQETSSQETANQADTRAARSRRLLSAVYAGWLLQSFGLQHAMDYIHVPALLLALAVIAAWNWQLDHALRRVAVVAFLLLAVLASPMLQAQRLTAWTSCWLQGSSPQMRATLAHGNFPDWQHLHNVVQYLESQNVKDGQLTCANVHSVHIYNALDVTPATRYWCVTILRELFRDRAEQIDAALLGSRQRFLVVEDREQGLARTGAALPTADSATVVFRSGTYTVYATDRQQ